MSSDTSGDDASTGEATTGVTGPTAETSGSHDGTSGGTATDGGSLSTSDTGSNDDSVCIIDGNEEPPSFCDFYVPECGPGPHGCPVGQKCSLAETCEPLPPDPAEVGEPCTVAPSGGIDDCVVDALCVGAPGEPEGVCFPACEAPYPWTCPEDEVCLFLDAGPICRPRCDPFAPQCDEGTVCHLWWDEEIFACSPPVGTVVGEGEPCEHELELEPICDMGLVCVPGDACYVICDVDDPDPGCTNACTSAGLAGYPNVGFCV